MTRQRKVGAPSRGFVMLMIAVLVIIVVLLLIASRYRQSRPNPNLERKGVALLLPPARSYSDDVIGHPGELIAEITYSRSLQA